MIRPGLLALLLLASVVPACAREPAPNRYWSKPTPYTQVEFDRDDYQCRRENTVTGYSSGVFLGSVYTDPYNYVDRDMHARCMNARGWQLVTVPAPVKKP